MPSWNRNGTRCETILLFDLHGIFSCLFVHSSKYYYHTTIPQTQVYSISQSCLFSNVDKNGVKCHIYCTFFPSGTSVNCQRVWPSERNQSNSCKFQEGHSTLWRASTFTWRGTYQGPRCVASTHSSGKRQQVYRNAIQSWLFNSTCGTVSLCVSYISHVLGCTKLLSSICR